MVYLKVDLRIPLFKCKYIGRSPIILFPILSNKWWHNYIHIYILFWQRR